MAEKEKKVDWLMAEKAFDVAVKALFIVLTMLVAVIAYQGREVLNRIADHEVRLTKVEASRYTPADAKRDQRLAHDDMKDFITLHLVPVAESLREIKEAVKENRDARSK